MVRSTAAMPTFAEVTANHRDGFLRSQTPYPPARLRRESTHSAPSKNLQEGGRSTWKTTKPHSCKPSARCMSSIRAAWSATDVRMRARTKARTIPAATGDSQYVQSLSQASWTSERRARTAWSVCLVNARAKKSPLRRAHFPHGHTARAMAEGGRGEGAGCYGGEGEEWMLAAAARVRKRGALAGRRARARRGVLAAAARARSGREGKERALAAARARRGWAGCGEGEERALAAEARVRRARAGARPRPPPNKLLTQAATAVPSQSPPKHSKLSIVLCPRIKG